MPSEQITVVFDIVAGRREAFLKALQEWDERENETLSFRAGDKVEQREALTKFTARMEEVLRRHDHKQSWRTDPIEMLVRKLKLELMEFDIAYDFHRWDEARNEAVDLANFCLIVFDRLGMPDVQK